MLIDSHHHLWNYDPTQYPWIDADKSILARDYLAGDLKRQIDASNISGTVVVQARQSLEETRWLLELTSAHSFIKGVVGWVPLVDRDVEHTLSAFAGEAKLKAVRHVLQDEADDAYMLRDDFNHGITKLADFGLVYDILIFEKHLANTMDFVDKHPLQPFVLDHIGKPSIRDTRFNKQWADQIRELARRDHVVCKFSGVATEVQDLEWCTELIRPYYDTALEAFGPNRLMFGTDWPVCLLRTDYNRWVTTVRELIAGLSASEQNQIMGETASRVYRLETE